jgi:hypothetical protein
MSVCAYMFMVLYKTSLHVVGYGQIFVRVLRENLSSTGKILENRLKSCGFFSKQVYNSNNRSLLRLRARD